MQENAEYSASLCLRCAHKLAMHKKQRRNGVNMLKEFKKFALRGNVFDLAVGIIIGGAFTTIVNSLVNDIVMPIFSIFTKRIDFSNRFIALDGKHYNTLEQAQEKTATINYGMFLSGVLNFIIMAFVVFLMVRAINKLKRPEPVITPETRKCPYCLSDIPVQATRCPFCTSQVEEK
jgi:large conductance mechanosensitive channel